MGIVRETRLLLEPGAFDGGGEEAIATVARIAALVRSAARSHSAVVRPPRDPDEQPFELEFLDTETRALDARSLRLRSRARVGRGRAAGAFELSLAFRAADLATAAAGPVEAAPQFESVEQLLEERVLAKDLGPDEGLGYARVATLREHPWELGRRLADFARVFPHLAELGLLPTLVLRTVGGTLLHERRFALGSVDFGRGATTVSLSLLRDARSGAIGAAELVTAVLVPRGARPDPTAARRSERFLDAIRTGLDGCLAPAPPGLDPSRSPGAPVLDAAYALAVRGNRA